MRVERVKGFHYRSLLFKNIIKNQENQVRESIKEHTNKNLTESNTIKKCPSSGFEQMYMMTNQKNCKKYWKEKQNKKVY